MIGYRSWEVFKKILLLGDPFYMLVDSKGITHQFCNEQALVILYNDGFSKEADHFQKQLGILNRGVYWADRGWKCFAHYLDPDVKKGLGPWPDATRECKSYFQQALNLWKQGKKTGAYFYLGAALHLVQDLCVPHHANGVAFNGHQDFEKWARENRYAYRVKSEGIYNPGKEPEQWVYNNARIAKKYYQPARFRDREFYDYIAGVLLPLAQRTTAGFLHCFLAQLN